MQEMVELSKQPSMPSATEPQAVFFRKPDNTFEILMAGPSHFSRELHDDDLVRQQMVFAQPFLLCSCEYTIIHSIIRFIRSNMY